MSLQSLEVASKGGCYSKYKHDFELFQEDVDWSAASVLSHRGIEVLAPALDVACACWSLFTAQLSCQLANLRPIVWAHSLLQQPFFFVFTLNKLCQACFSLQPPQQHSPLWALVAFLFESLKAGSERTLCFWNRSKIAVELFCSVIPEKQSCCENRNKWVHVSLISPWPSLITASSSAVDPAPRRWLLTLLIVSACS